MAGTVASSRFVGRTAELGRLQAAFAHAGGGDPLTLCVGGEAGVGKTRLVARFAGRVRERGGQVLLGGCVELGETALPYAPLAAARARAGGGLDRPGRRLVGAGAAVRGTARPAGAPGRPVPDRAGGGGPALGRPLDPGPARLPRPQPPGRAARGADLPHRRAAPPPSPAPVPGRAGPQRPGGAARGGPLRPSRGRRPAGRHHRDETGRRARRPDLPPLGGQRILRRGAARRHPAGSRQRAQPAPESRERPAEPRPGPARGRAGDAAAGGRGRRPGRARAAGRGQRAARGGPAGRAAGGRRPPGAGFPIRPPRPTRSGTR
jgi:hypothetical protein